MMRAFAATGWRHLQAQFELLKREHATPARLGVALGIGVVLGCSPFLGFQVLLALGMARLFQLNRLALLLGVQVSIPPLTPVVLFATAQAGALVLRGHWLPLRVSAFRGEPAGKVLASVFVDMLVGTVVLGGPLAVLLGTLGGCGLWWGRASKALAQRLTPEGWTELGARLGALPRDLRSYANWKLRLDPVYALALAEVPSEGELVDLGTGIGLLPALLGLTRPFLRIRAVEWDPRKAETARSLLRSLPHVTVEEEDARTVPLGAPNVIALLDILHYSPLAEAQRWLAACAQALGPGGMLLVRDLEPSRWALAPVLERIAVAVRWNRGVGVYPRPSSELERQLTGLGFAVERRQAGRGVFRANTLTIARREVLRHGD